MRPVVHSENGPRVAAGFTLIEVLAVILLITLVLGVALDFYVDLSNASTHASAKAKVGERGTIHYTRSQRGRSRPRRNVCDSVRSMQNATASGAPFTVLPGPPSAL